MFKPMGGEASAMFNVMAGGGGGATAIFKVV